RRHRRWCANLTVRPSLGSRPARLRRRGHGIARIATAWRHNAPQSAWTRLESAEADEFEAEAFGLDLLDISLRSMRTASMTMRGSTQVRRMRAIERVKEAVALAPADGWNLAKLSKVANLSPFHLCHVFRQMVGTSIYDYVLQERLAHTLDDILEAAVTSRQSPWTPDLQAIATSPRVSE